MGLVVRAVTDEQVDQICGDRPSALCRWSYRATESKTVAELSKFLVDRPLTILVTLVVAVVAAVIGRRFIRRFGRRLTERRTAGLGPDALSAARIATLTAVMASAFTALVWSIAILSILSTMGVSLVPLLATAGVATAALGFGAQSIVRDFLSGFFMLFEGQFEVGDLVDVGEATGTVEAITLRRTQLRGVDGTVWHVPNGVIQRVGNRSQQWSQAVLDQRVAADTDLARAEVVLGDAVRSVCEQPAWSDVVLAPPEVWGVEEVGPEGVIIRVVVRTQPGQQFALLRALRLGVKEAFDREGIRLPPPLLARPAPPGGV